MEYREIKLFEKKFYLGEENGKLTWAHWQKPLGLNNKSNAFLIEVEKQLTEYLVGKRKKFTFNLKPVGTPFQENVWRELLKVSWGKTLSYSEIANALGNPLSVRAVASAIGKNPIAVFIPCHRVIAKDGSLGGFSGGLPTKKKLLSLEGHSF